MSINTQTLVYKTKDELYYLLYQLIDDLKLNDLDGYDENIEYSTLEDIEQVVYVLRNCDYEGKL